MDLTEFLLARIAEDEEVARPMLRRVYQDHNEGLFEFEDCWNSPILCVDPRRALSECEAKRRIAKRLSVIDAGVDITGGPEFRSGVLYAVMVLAETYADHPDYDEEWRS